MKAALLGLVLAAATLAAGELECRPQPKQTSVNFADIGALEFETPQDGCVIRYTLNGSAPAADSRAYCTPLKIAASCKVKAACFKGADHGPVVEIECVCTPGATNAAKPTVAINLDFSQTPELKDWALRAQKDAEAYYEKIVTMLASDGFSPPRQIDFIFVKNDKDIAWANGNTITFADGWIKKRPHDTGTTIHELAHVIQSYKGKGPHWLVEGIADYVRWFTWEPLEKRPKISPARAKYTNGYQDAGAFLDWLVKAKDKDIVTKLNAAIRANEYSDELFKGYCGKDVGALWDEFVESLKK